MKRARVPVGAIFAVVCAFAASRDGYRSAYRAWREMDPTLERDAGSAGAALAARADKMAAAAAQYGAERSGFLRAVAVERQTHIGWLETPAGGALVDVPASVANQVAAQTAVVRRTMATFANDPDPGIQQLQAVLTQENTALTALAAAIADRQKAFDGVRAANTAIEVAREKALAEQRELIAGLGQAAADADRQKAAWIEYYTALSEEARGISAPPARIPPTAPPAPLSDTTPSSIQATAPQPAISAPAEPRSPSITPLPLLRYTGDWTYPTSGLYKGSQPELIDLVVHEENGHADGSFSGRFKVPPGSKDDPVLRFTFVGEFRNTRNQMFTLETSDGAKGTLELIPGPAFNLLEINFQIEPKPGKIRQANVVLVKK